MLNICLILNVIESITGLSAPKINTANIDKLVKSYKNLNIEQAVAKMRTDGIAEAEIRATLAAQHYTEADIQQALATRATNVAKTQNVTLTKLQTTWQYALAAGAKVANVALTAGLGILLSIVVSKFISWLTNATEKQENLAEAALDAKNNLDSLFETINTKKATVNEVAEEYAKLAQGVDQLTGKNLSLSTEDYDRFLELSNQLGEQFPELTRKFDDNGNAILDLTGNVDGIVGSLNDLVKVQQDLANQELSSNMSTVYEDYYEKTRKIKEKIKKENNKQTKLEDAKETLINSPRAFTMTQSAERVKLENAADTFGLDYTTKEVETKDGKTGFVVDIEGLTLYEDVIERYNDLYHQSIVDLSAYKSQLSAEENEINRYIIACLQPDLATFDFGENDSVLKTAIEELFVSFDPENLPDNIDASNWNEVYSYLRRMYLYPISQLKGDVQKQLVDVFSKPQGISNTEYIDMVAELQRYFDENHIDINLDFVVKDENDLEQRFNNAISRITGGDKKESIKIGDFIEDKEIDSYDEKEYFIDVTSEANSAEEAINLYNKAINEVDTWTPIDPEPINESLESIRNAYKVVSDAITEYEDYNYLSLETIQSLIQLDDEYLECLYNEEGQLTLNTDAYNKLTRAKLEEMKVAVINNALDTIESLSSENEAAKYLKDTNIDLASVNWDLFESNIALAESELALLGNTEAVEKRQQALDQIASSTKARIELINQALGSVGEGQNNGGFYTGHSGSTKSDKNEIDWMEQSLSVLQEAVDDAQTALNDTHGFDAQITAITTLNEKLKDLRNGYKKSYKEYDDRYTTSLSKLSNGETIRGYIESGKKFDLSKYDADTAKIIQEAIDAYNSKIEAENKIKELGEQIRDNNKLEKSKVRQEKYETQLSGVQTDLQNNNLTASEKNNLLKKELEYQNKINDELIKQAKYEGDVLEVENLKKEKKQNERDSIAQKWQNKIDENQNTIDAKNTLLESKDLTESEIDDINTTLEDLTETDYKNKFKQIINQLDVDNKWTNYINELKKKYGQEDKSNKAFAKEHIQEIIEHFSYTGMEGLYYEFVNSIDDFGDKDYENHSATRSYYINDNNNKIANIQSDIDYAGGRGTEQQYRDMQSYHQSNLTYWIEQKKEAETFLDAQTEGTAGWDDWNSKLQEAQNNIDSCERSIKDCNIEILKLPLNDIEDELKDIENQLYTVNDQIDDYNTYISAANFILDTQIREENEKKELLEDQVTALEKTNEARNAELQLQKSLYNLEKLRNQKTEKVFKEGQGWIYESNVDDIKNAQKEYDDAVYNNKVTGLNQQIKEYDESIKKLNRIKDKWSVITTNAQGSVDLNKALNYDNDFFNKVLNGDTSLIADIQSNMTNLVSSKDALEEEQEKYQELQDLINDTIDAYELEAISYDLASQKISTSIQTYFPELAGKYNFESGKLQEIITKKGSDAEVTKTSTKNINETVDESNKKLLENYTKFKEDLGKVFEDLNSMLQTYVNNTNTMVTSIATAVSQIQSQINSLSSLNANISITSDTDADSGGKKNDKKKTKADDAGHSHSGLELGYIGGSSSNDKEAFKYIALSELKDDEIVRVLQKGEGVVNSPQITQVMDNFRKLAQFKVPTIVPNNPQNNQSVNFTGDIVINNPIGDSSRLAKEIKQNFGSQILQELYRK